jgi:hypothetical protein
MEILQDGEPVAANHIFVEGEKCGFSERQIKIAKQNLAKRGVTVVTKQTKEGWTWQCIAF